MLDYHIFLHTIIYKFITVSILQTNMTIDYDERHGRLLIDTFDTDIRDEYEPLWHLIDVNFDEGARAVGELLCDIEDICRCVEDFCIYKNITNIPPLYASIFEARNGFLTQCKMPSYMSKAWLTRFPHPIVVRDYNENELIKAFKSFLENNRNKPYNGTYLYALYDLRRFINDKSSSEDD